MFDSEISESDLAARGDTHERRDIWDLSPPKPGADTRPEPQAPEKSKPDSKPKADEKSKPDEKPKAEAADDKGAKDEKPKVAFWRRRPLLTVSLLALAVVIGAAGYVYYDNASHYESTDDAFVAARQVAIAPQVTGYVDKVPVTDNQHVEAGDVIAKLDARTYQAALDQAEAQVAAAKASVANAQAQRDVQTAQIAAAKAQVDQAKATLAFAQQQASRYTDLAKTGSGTVQNAQQYTSQLGQQDAALKTAEAQEQVAERQIEALDAQLASAQANLSVAEAQRESAALNVGYTTVTASEPGRVVNLTAEPGEFAQPGTNLTMFVPDEIWIVANFKETQLDHMRPGQPVTLSIDAYPDHDWKGHVASVQPGSGTAFSLLPAQNATGNYVKVVQRVPVKIVLDNAPSDVTLGPGMSVDPTVRVDPTPSLWERIVGKANEWRRG